MRGVVTWCSWELRCTLKRLQSVYFCACIVIVVYRYCRLSAKAATWSDQVNYFNPKPSVGYVKWVLRLNEQCQQFCRTSTWLEQLGILENFDFIFTISQWTAILQLWRHPSITYAICVWKNIFVRCRNTIYDYEFLQIIW